MTNEEEIKKFNTAYTQRPLAEVCDRLIEIQIVGDRCIYINDHRVEGGKPYVSENLPTKVKTTRLRDILDAFSEDEIKEYLREKVEVAAYLNGVNAYRAAGEKE